MKKALSKMLAMMLTAALLLSGCGGGTTAEKPAENGETTTAQGEEKERGVEGRSKTGGNQGPGIERDCHFGDGNL